MPMEYSLLPRLDHHFGFKERPSPVEDRQENMPFLAYTYSNGKNTDFTKRRHKFCSME
jgi:hypothetical protein